jgi:hypothetical protein
MRPQEIRNLLEEYPRWIEIESAEIDTLLDEYILLSNQEIGPIGRFFMHESMQDYLLRMKASDGIEPIGVIFHEKCELVRYKQLGYGDDQLELALKEKYNEAHAYAALEEHNLYRFLFRHKTGGDIPLSLLVHTSPFQDGLKRRQDFKHQLIQFGEEVENELLNETFTLEEIYNAFDFWEACGHQYKNKEEICSRIKEERKESIIPPIHYTIQLDNDMTLGYGWLEVDTHRGRISLRELKSRPYIGQTVFLQRGYDEPINPSSIKTLEDRAYIIKEVNPS